MAQDSENAIGKNISKPSIELIYQIRELYGRVTYSHKTHEKTADIYQRRNQRIKIAQVLLSAITTGSLIVAIWGEERIGTILGALFSTALFALNAYSKDINLGELIQQHIYTANKLWDIRECYFSLLTDLESGVISELEARIVRDEILAACLSIQDNAPRTLKEAYREAQDALQINEELSFSEHEIDKFLPAPLRKSN